jgi:hypothetical protein
MARFHISGVATVVGTSARAIASLFAPATGKGIIREISCSNTTSTAVIVGVIRFSAATNVGAGLTEAEYDTGGNVPLCTGFAGHTADGTTSGGAIDVFQLGAAVGSGIVWTYGGDGLIVPEGTANGVGIYIPSGTGQICTYRITWDE